MVVKALKDLEVNPIVRAMLGWSDELGWRVLQQKTELSSMLDTGHEG